MITCSLSSLFSGSYLFHVLVGRSVKELMRLMFPMLLTPPTVCHAPFPPLKAAITMREAGPYRRWRCVSMSAGQRLAVADAAKRDFACAPLTLRSLSDDSLLLERSHSESLSPLDDAEPDSSSLGTCSLSSLLQRLTSGSSDTGQKLLERQSDRAGLPQIPLLFY